MPSNAETLVHHYPELFHVSEPDAWRGIARHGLRSTRNLLNLFEIDDDRCAELLCTRRATSTLLDHPVHGAAHIRDQIPLSLTRLESALTDMTVGEWLELLNSLCFFWPTIERVERLLRASHYAGRCHDVLVVDTKALVARQAEAIRVAAINTGATRPFARPRGRDTFLPLEDFPLSDRLGRVGRAGAVAEVAVEDAVPEIGEMLLRVERWVGPTNEMPLWIRSGDP
jgi:hypothetical protein